VVCINWRFNGLEAGGNIKDPRIGTKYSVLDKDYHVRNYLWLLSSNSLILFDLLVCYQFVTIFVYLLLG
jgi:hypothetical protein